MANYIFQTGTLTITCFVHPDYKNGIKRYHGTTRVATIKNLHQDEISSTLKKEIDLYLSRCKLKNCERTFSWKFETL